MATRGGCVFEVRQKHLRPGPLASRNKGLSQLSHRFKRAGPPTGSPGSPRQALSARHEDSAKGRKTHRRTGLCPHRGIEVQRIGIGTASQGRISDSDLSIESRIFAAKVKSHFCPPEWVRRRLDQHLACARCRLHIGCVDYSRNQITVGGAGQPRRITAMPTRWKLPPPFHPTRKIWWTRLALWSGASRCVDPRKHWTPRPTESHSGSWRKSAK